MEPAGGERRSLESAGWLRGRRECPGREMGHQADSKPGRAGRLVSRTRGSRGSLSGRFWAATRPAAKSRILRCTRRPYRCGYGLLARLVCVFLARSHVKTELLEVPIIKKLQKFQTRQLIVDVLTFSLFGFFICFGFRAWDLYTQKPLSFRCGI